ncbi:MAG: transposase [Bacteroidota bacterium]
MKRNIVKRYSESFKHQVVHEVESGQGSVQELRRKYGLSPSTIQYWIKRIGKLELLPKLIRVEKPDEKDRIKELERQIRQLKESLADTQVDSLINKSYFEVLCEEQGLDPEEVKKNLRGKRSSKP